MPKQTLILPAFVSNHIIPNLVASTPSRLDAHVHEHGPIPVDRLSHALQMRIPTQNHVASTRFRLDAHVDEDCAIPVDRRLAVHGQHASHGPREELRRHTLQDTLQDTKRPGRGEEKEE